MNLKQYIDDYGIDDKHINIKLKESFLEFSKWKLSYAYQSGECIYCPSCKKSTAIWFRKLNSPKLFPKVERRCKDCLIKEIFGDFEK